MSKVRIGLAGLEDWEKNMLKIFNINHQMLN